MGNVICMWADKPWVKPFDLRGDGGIDSTDLETWVKKVNALPEVDVVTGDKSDFPLSELKLSSDILCNLFKWDMIRMQFVHENAYDEMRRQRPLSYNEADRLIDKVREDRDDSIERIQKAVDADINSLSSVFQELGVDKGGKPIVFSFALYADIKYGARNIIDSLVSERPSLAGVGILFEKLDGGPARITDLKPEAEEQIPGLMLYGAWIVRIDGESIRDMSQEEVRNALRGPLGSTVEVAVEYDNGEVQDISLKRDWLPRYFAT